VGKGSPLTVTIFDDTTFYAEAISEGSCTSNNRAALNIISTTAPAVSITTVNDTFCIGDSLLLTASSSSPYAYTWNGPGIPSGGVTGTSIRVSPQVVSEYSVLGENTGSGCADSESRQIVPVREGRLSVSSPGAVCAGQNVAFSANSTSENTLRITEITVQNFDPGGQSNLPSFINGSDDFIEITNLGTSQPVDFTDYKLEFYEVSGTFTQNASYTFPTGATLQPGEVAVVCFQNLSSGTNVSNNYYVAQTTLFTSNFNELGVVLKDASGNVIDVATFGDFQRSDFPAAANVTAADWQNGPQVPPNAVKTNTAGIRLVGTDENSTANWVWATNDDPQTISILNPGLVRIPDNLSFTWNPGNLQQKAISFTAADPITYTLTVTDGFCTSQDSFLIQPGLAPVADIIGDPCSDPSLPLQLALSDTQTYNPGPTVSIPDNSPAGALSAITINGIGGTYTGSDLGLSVILNVSHGNISQLTGYLLSPNNDTVLLFDQPASGGANLTNTVFSTTASAVLGTGTAPYTSEFRPQDASGFTALEGAPINGNWRLLVVDNATGITGSITDWELELYSGPSVTYAWRKNPGPTNVIGNQRLLSDSSPFSATYDLSVTSSQGCRATDTIFIDRVGVQVSATADQTQICPATPIDLRAVIFGGTGDVNFTWNQGLPANDTVTVSPSSPTTYQIIAEDECNRSDTASITINVFDQPFQLSGLSNDTLFCGDLALNFQIFVSAQGGGGQYQYLWNNGLSNQRTQNINPDSTETYVISVAEFCGDTLTDSIVVQVNEPLSINVNAPAQVCAGEPVTLEASVTGGSEPFTYNWNNGLGSGPNVTSSFTQDISVTLNVVDADDLCRDFETVNIAVNPLPIAGFVPNVTGANVSFDNQSSDGTNFSWDFGDGAGTSTAPNPSYEYDRNGTFTVKLVASNSCGVDSIEIPVQITAFVGRNDALASANLMLYPNPTEGVAYLSADELPTEDLQLTVLDGTGRVLLEDEIGATNGQLNHRLDISHLPVGVYEIRVMAAGSRWTSKLVKQ